MSDNDLINELLTQPKARPQVRSAVTPPDDQHKQAIDSILGVNQTPVSGQQPNYDVTKPTRNALEYFNERTGRGIEVQPPSIHSMVKFISPSRGNKASQVLDILNTDEPDSVKESNLKKIFPNIQVYTDNEKKSKYIVINGERLDLFTPGTEGYKTVPNIVFRENGQPIPAGDRVNKLRQYLTQKGSVNIGGAEVPTFDERKLVDFDKNTVIGQDRYGNQTITFKKEMVLDDSGGVMSKLSDMFGTNRIAPGTYYLEKPVGIDLSKEGIINKMQGIGKFANDPENQMTMLGGFGPGVVKSSIGMGVGATLGSGLKQRIETGEPADPLTALKSGGFAMGGGLVGGLAISGLSKMVNAALGKSVVNEAGMFRPEMMKDIMKQRGMSYEDMAQLIASKQKVKLNDAQMADLVTWLKTGNVPTAGQLIGGKQGAIEKGLFKAEDPTTMRVLQGQTNTLEGNMSKLPSVPQSPGDLVKAGQGTDRILNELGNKAVSDTNKAYAQFYNSDLARKVVPTHNIQRRIVAILEDENTRTLALQNVVLRNKLREFGLIEGGQNVRQMTAGDAQKLIQRIDDMIRRTPKTQGDKREALDALRNTIQPEIDAFIKRNPAAGEYLSGAKNLYIEERTIFDPQGFQGRYPGVRGPVKMKSNIVKDINTDKIQPSQIYEKMESLPVEKISEFKKVILRHKDGEKTLNQLYDARANDLYKYMQEANKKNNGLWDSNAFNKYIDSLDGKGKELFSPKQWEVIEQHQKMAIDNFGHASPPVDWRNLYRRVFNTGIGKGIDFLPHKRGVTFESSQFSINRGAKEAWKQLNGEGSNMPSVFGGGLFSRQLFDPDNR